MAAILDYGASKASKTLETRKMCAIEDQFESLCKNIAVVDELVNALEVRITPILFNGPTADCNDCSAKQGELSVPFANKLKVQNELLVSIQTRLQDIRTRVEL